MATNTKVLKAILLVVAAMALPSIGSAQNENGVLQYIDVIPPDYCFLLIAPTAKCPTTMAAEADKGVRVGPEEGEIARHDRMLLETYLSVDDIEDLRDRRLELIESQIKLAEVYLDNLRKKLVGRNPRRATTSRTRHARTRRQSRKTSPATSRRRKRRSIRGSRRSRAGAPIRLR